MTYLLPAFVGIPQFNRVYNVEAMTLLKALPDESVNCIITSPPYFGLRSYLPTGDYNKVREIGLEPTPQAYVATLVELFHEARRVLRADGTLWIVIADTYANDEKWGGATGGKHAQALHGNTSIGREKKTTGLPGKNLLGIPWRVAFALQDDGWILRSDIIWAKSNPMPESVTDRPTKSHEYVFLFAKSPRYYYDAAAIAEPSINNGGAPFSSKYADAQPNHGGTSQYRKQDAVGKRQYTGFNERYFTSDKPRETRNKRDVWTVNPQPFAGSHFATFPPALIEPMILAGCPSQVCSVCGAPWVQDMKVERIKESDSPRYSGVSMRNDAESARTRALRYTNGFKPTCTCKAPTHPGLTLDPFMGAGTTAVVAQKLGRNYIGSELNPEYCEMARRRIQQQTLPLPLFDTVVSQEAP